MNIATHSRPERCDVIDGGGMRPAAGQHAIDVSGYVAQMERTLRAGADQAACARALAILERWRFDSMLDEHSRTIAETLVREFHAKLFACSVR